MKIKNILLLSLLALSFASCSKEDDPGIEQQEPVDAVVSFIAKATTQPGTKAEGTPTDTKIYSLNAYIADTDGNVVGYGRKGAIEGESGFSSDKTVDKIDGILVKIVPNLNATYKAVLIANIADCQVKNLNEIAGKAGLDKAIEKYAAGDKALPMVRTLNISGLKESEKQNGVYVTNNWIDNAGGAVKDTQGAATAVELTRMLARVTVNKITVNLSGYEPIEGQQATFKLETLSLVNVRSGADLELKGIGAYVKGYQSSQYVFKPQDTGWIIPSDGNGNLEGAENVTKGAIVPGLSGSISASAENTKTYSAADLGFTRYIFPNGAKVDSDVQNLYETGLVIGGKFQRAPGYPEELKHFRVYLRDSNASDALRRVVANTSYLLDITISGEGSGDENHPQDNLDIIVTITAEGWEPMEQEEEVTPQ